MKKKKSPQQAPPADFNHQPFKSLKTLKSGLKDPKPEPRPAVTISDSGEDEEALFLRSVSGARAIHAEEEQPPVLQPQASKLTKESDRSEEVELFLDAMKKIGANLRAAPAECDLETGGSRQSASRRIRQLKRGTLRIRAELDLHGSLREEALLKLERFVRAASARGDEAILVITGKGINSPDGPVLQGAVAEWLRGKGKAMVADFCPAPRDRGGSGAFVLFLRNIPSG